LHSAASSSELISADAVEIYHLSPVRFAVGLFAFNNFISVVIPQLRVVVNVAKAKVGVAIIGELSYLLFVHLSGPIPAI